ncbi:MAG: hypothetical protein GXN92_01025 [Candidatus Micrarchaeota archaeon]|nr:hypothetical protein [Candidatus Micrarchaeota archaeon]
MKKLLPLRDYKYTKKYQIYEPPVHEKILDSLKKVKVSVSFDFLKRFINYIRSDPIGLIIWLLIAGMIGGILYGFWWVISLAGQMGGPTLSEVNLTLWDSFYVYYGRIGDLGEVPLLQLNLTGTEREVLAQVYGGYPMQKEIYVLKSHHPDFYNWLILFPYPVKVVEPAELRYIPAGSLLIIFDDTLPAGTTANLSANPNPLTIFIVTDTPPIKEYSGTVPTPVNYLLRRNILDEVVKAAGPPYEVREGKYRVKGSYLYGNFSSFTVTGDGKIVVIHPAGFESYENISTMVKDLLTTIRSAYWIVYGGKHAFIKNNFGLVTPAFKITYNHTVYPLPRSKIDMDHVVVIVPEKDWVGAHQKLLFTGMVASENGPILLPFSSTEREETFRYSIYAYNNEIVEDVVNVSFTNFSEEVYRQTLGRTVVNVERRFGVPIKFPEGPYLVNLTGIENLYALYYFEVGKLQIEVVPEIKRGRFRFFFRTSSGSPVTLPQVEIYDPQAKIRREYSYVSEVVYTRPEWEGKELPEGTYYFNVTVGQETYTVQGYVPPKTALARLFTPERIALLVIAALIYGVSVFLRRKEEPIYTIDIPDFPPQSTVKVEVSEDEMKELFDFINRYYKWEYMPLEKEELEFGLSQKKPELADAVIDDYTFSIFLDELIHRGLIKESRGYYGLVDWEKESGFTIEQLAMYRILRDKAIELAIPIEFNLDRSKGYHAKLELYNPVYIYFYHPKEFYYIVNNLPKFVGKGELVVLFDDYEQKERFKTQLYEGTVAADYLKFLINSGVVKLYTIDEFLEDLKKYIG